MVQLFRYWVTGFCLIVAFCLTFLARKSLEQPGRIPMHIILTGPSIERVRPFVWRNLLSLNPRFRVSYFDDAACDRFLRSEFGPAVAARFWKLERGAHKADLFRYAFLFHQGGVYWDLDLQPYAPLTDFIDFNSRKRLYTVLSVFNRSISQMFLACPPGNAVMWESIKDVMTYPPVPYMKYCSLLFQRLEEQMPSALLATGQVLSFSNDQGEMFLFEERNDGLPGEKPDTYGGHYWVFDKKKRIFRARYSEWGSKQFFGSNMSIPFQRGKYGEFLINN